MTDHTPRRTLTESEAAVEAARIIAAAYRQEPAALPAVTSYRDHSPVPAVGDAAPAVLPDTRAVPQWATGIAVAALGVGLGSTGLGAAAWLVLDGLSSVTLLGVLAIAAPFAGLAVVVLAAGAAWAKARSAGGTPTTHIYEGTVNRHTEITAPTTVRGMFSRNRTEITD
ncbi:hypothetical protein GCM10010441_44770 [Kitasatospora paracochleata]|uniref:Superfamily III holin-X n=1 Tax=Kitasatospora paracochleata TaxID=58354 RepID=A0ABT1JAB4_9ACTN|nr:hypothetical protein [Kitasatospora paracochleata]MCP2314054.1 hypothetical protein [Kitasatospora paracochleata]